MHGMNATPAVPPPICLDAAAPLVTPRGLAALLPVLRAGGVNAVCATVASLEDCRTTVGVLAEWLTLARAGTLPMRLATTVAEARAARAAGQVAVLLHFQGGAPLERDARLLDVYHALGVRIVQLTYNDRNLLGDGCLEPRDAGLSAFGRRVVRGLVARRMVVDIAHGGVRTSLEAIELAAADGAPTIASHANAHGVCAHPRNLPDEVLGAIAASGGVVGLCAFPAFVSSDPLPTLEQLLDHAVYIAELVGPQHVALGLDFADEDEDDYVYYGYDPRYYPKPPWTWPTGIAGFGDVPNIRAGLLARGFSASEVAGIMGEHMLAVFERVWGG
jgi:membrane dipeptidase